MSTRVIAEYELGYKRIWAMRETAHAAKVAVKCAVSVYQRRNSLPHKPVQDEDLTIYTVCDDPGTAYAEWKEITF